MSDTVNLDYYQNHLIAAICKAGGLDGRRPFRDAQSGGIYLELHGGAQLYCTPGWESDWTGLPIEFLDEDGETIESASGWHFIDWTFDVQRDVALWQDKVREVLG